MNVPFFSIVTICFNSEKTIERTIVSVLSQDYDNYEYIIIDGASTDNTLHIVNAYVKRPEYKHKMRVFSEKDNGIYDAFNKGCKKSVGKYIWLVNSDDYIESNALSIVYNKIKQEKEPYPIISGGLRFIYSNGMPDQVAIMTKERAIVRYRQASIGINHPATLVPKDTYERIGYYDDRYRIMADMDWFRRAYESNERFLWIDDILTNMTEGGVSTTLHLRQLCSDRWLYTKKFYHTPFKRINAYYKWFNLYLRGIIKLWLKKTLFALSFKKS